MSDNTKATSITVKQRRSNVNDYIAYITGHLELWESGSTTHEALGKLLANRKENFGVDIKFVDDKCNTLKSSK